MVGVEEGLFIQLVFKKKKKKKSKAVVSSCFVDFIVLIMSLSVVKARGTLEDFYCRHTVSVYFSRALDLIPFILTSYHWIPPVYITVCVCVAV